VFTDADVELGADFFARLARGWGCWDGICGPKLSRGAYAAYYRRVAAGQRLAYALLGIAGASGSNMAMTRAAFDRAGGFRNVLLYLFCRHPRVPDLLYDDWGYWAPAHVRPSLPRP
jgi:hypothetical protein